MPNRHSFVRGFIITTSLLCTSQTVFGAPEVNTYSKTDFAMDTVVSETLYTTGEDITADVITALISSSLIIFGAYSSRTARRF